MSVFFFKLLKYFLSPTLLHKNNLLSLPEKHHPYQYYQHWYFLNSVPSSQMYTNNTFTNDLFLKWLFLDCVEELKALNSSFLKQLIIRMPIRRTAKDRDIQNNQDKERREVSHSHYCHTADLNRAALHMKYIWGINKL